MTLINGILNLIWIKLSDNLLESIIAIIKDMWKSKSGEINLVQHQPGALCTLTKRIRIHTQNAFILKFGVVFTWRNSFT